MFRGLLLTFLLPIGLRAQPATAILSNEAFIESYKEEAVEQMLLYKIPASIIMAQAIVESGYGSSPLALYANNHFGIKCHTTWDGPTFILDDDEKNECFRKYSSVSESFDDHSRFILTRKWYKPLFELKRADYKAWSYGLKKSGYATHPRYAEMLIEMIEREKLYDLDKLSLIEPVITGQ